MLAFFSYKKKSFKIKLGFSLIELGITLGVISALSVTVVYSGMIIDSAKVQVLIREQYQIRSAIQNFQNKFTSLPGDMYDADARLSPDSADLKPRRGNINNKIENTLSTEKKEGCFTTESYEAWRHLYMSTFYDENLDGCVKDENLTSGNYSEVGVNVPDSDILKSNNGYFLTYQSSSDTLTDIGNTIEENYYHLLYLGNFSTQSKGVPTFGSISSKQARAIDAKLDDGRPMSGHVISLNDKQLGCHDGETPDSSIDVSYYKNTEYKSAKNPSCIVIYKLYELPSSKK